MRRQELHPYTEIINTTQKNKSRAAKLHALQWLAKTFPAVFNTSLSIQPLKIGILADIIPRAIEAGISSSKIRQALVIFTGRLEYLACLKAREWRVDLEGNPSTRVTEEDATAAANKIKKRIENGVRNTKTVTPAKKATPTVNTRFHTPLHSYSRNFAASPYDERISRANTQSKPAPVIVRHKNTRSYDPEAVARLKEKLGISRKDLEKTEETS